MIDDHDEHGDAASVVAIGIDMRERERWAMVAMMKNHGDG